MLCFVCLQRKPIKYLKNNLLMNLFYMFVVFSFFFEELKKSYLLYIDNKVKLIANTQAYKHNFKSHKKPTNLIFCFQVKTHLITINKLCFIKQTKVKQQRLKRDRELYIGFYCLNIPFKHKFCYLYQRR